MEPIIIVLFILAILYGVGSYLWIRHTLGREKAEQNTKHP